jgi:hypothetical protein
MEEHPATIARVAISISGSPTRCHRLTTGDVELGRLYLSVSPSGTYVDSAGRRARLGWSSLWRREYKMWRGGLERGSARLLFPDRRVEITFGDSLFQLQAVDAAESGWRLVGDDGTPILSVFFSTCDPAEIAIHARVAVDLLMLAYYIAVICLRMESQFSQDKSKR